MGDARWTLCPECGSFDVTGDSLTPLGQIHECRDCGYEGSFVIEADSREDGLRIQRELEADREADEAEASGTAGEEGPD